MDLYSYTLAGGRKFIGLLQLPLDVQKETISKGKCYFYRPPSE